MKISSPRSAVAGVAAVALISVVPGSSGWAQTRTADAPRGLLTKLESARHDSFIDRAKQGDIDIVFFGTTSTEMWQWRDRGRSVWERTFGLLKAANFGSQGTRFESLVWRMRNGELDGYRAKLVVLQAWSGGDQAILDNRITESVAGYTAIIAEIRARQPQARLLIIADFPRGRLRHEPWRKVADANAAVYRKLADNETVFYIDIGERFFNSDGSYNREMWAGLPDPGIQTRAFEVWADALEPWLARFVR